MKKFENLESLWREQAIDVPGAAKQARATQVAIDRDVNRRGRILNWGVGCLVFGIIVTPLLAVLGYVHAGRPMTLMGLLHHAILLALQVGMLIGLLRRIRAHRKLLQKSAANVQENARVALEVIEEEMRDYRTAARIFPVLVLLDFASVANNFALGYFDEAGLGLRLLLVLAFSLMVGAVALRHYRYVLQPQKKQLVDLLDDLDAPQGGSTSR